MYQNLHHNPLHISDAGRGEEPRVFAHRGASAHAPGNSLRALMLACRSGARWIEVDVRRIGQQLYLLHDGWLETPAGLRQTHTMSPAELARAMPDGQCPLTLEQALSLLQGRAALNIEIKDEGSAALVVDTLDRYVTVHGWHYHDLLVSSFHQPELAQVRWLQPALPLGVLVAGVPLQLALGAAALGAESLHVSADVVTRPLVADAHSRGISVYAYTVNSPERWSALHDLGVDGLFTDYPERFSQLLAVEQSSTERAA